MWIKVCANTSLEDALLAADAGADALGFIFAPSPRRVTVEQVAQIAPQLPSAIQRYGVFVDASLEEVCQTIEVCGLNGVQLHSASDEVLQGIRQRYPDKREIGIIRVLHFQMELQSQLERLKREVGYDAVLIDSRTATAVGGTGIAFDWNAARKSFREQGHDLRLIVAGGLRPENVGEAIDTLTPWGVDVASGVEAAPGKKDPQRVREFVRRARLAAEALQTESLL